MHFLDPCDLEPERLCCWCDSALPLSFRQVAFTMGRPVRLFPAERCLVQLNNVNAFGLTVPDETECKRASLIAAHCLGCCPFVTYIVCAYMRIRIHTYLRVSVSLLFQPPPPPPPPSPAGLVTGHPGTAAQSGPAGKAARTVGRRPGEALTQPNPTPPPPWPQNPRPWSTISLPFLFGGALSIEPFGGGG